VSDAQTLAFQRQGYRPLSARIWAKPFGNGIIVFDTHDCRMSFKFRDLKGGVSG